MIKDWTAGDVVAVADRARADRKDEADEVARRLYIDRATARKLIDDSRAALARQDDDQ